MHEILPGKNGQDFLYSFTSVSLTRHPVPGIKGEGKIPEGNLGRLCRLPIFKLEI